MELQGRTEEKASTRGRSGIRPEQGQLLDQRDTETENSLGGGSLLALLEIWNIPSSWLDLSIATSRA